MWISGSFFCHFYFKAFTEFSCISTAECPAPEAGRHFLHGGMSNTSMGEVQNVPAPTEGFYSQIGKFPEESFILSSPCNSVALDAVAQNHAVSRICIPEISLGWRIFIVLNILHTLWLRNTLTTPMKPWGLYFSWLQTCTMCRGVPKQRGY